MYEEGKTLEQENASLEELCKGQLSQFQATFSQLEDRMKEVKHQAIRAKRKEDKLQSKIQSLQGQLEAKTNHILSNEAAIQQFKAEVRNYRRDINALKDSIAGSQTKRIRDRQLQARKVHVEANKSRSRSSLAKGLKVYSQIDSVLGPSFGRKKSSIGSRKAEIVRSNSRGKRDTKDSAQYSSQT